MDAPRIVTPVPGPKARAIIARDEKVLATSTKTSPVVVASAKGFVVEDVDGNRFLDFTAGIGVVNVGHSHPKVVAAIRDQAERFTHFAGTDYYYDAQVTYAERLLEVAPVADGKVFYTNSGTESNEAALKAARLKGPLVLAFLGAFHGRTLGALSLTASKAVQRAWFQPMPSGVTHVPFPNPYRNVWGIDGYDHPQELINRCLDTIEHVLDTVAPVEDVGACFIEPVQGEGGYVVPPRGFMAALSKMLRGHEILLAVDEVQTGFGRTGKLFAVEHDNVRPDLMSLAKSMASGVPIGALVLRRELDFPKKGMHSNTFGGNPVACRAGIATLEVLSSENLVENSARMGKILHEGLQNLKESDPRIGDARGLGLMQAIEFVRPETRTPDPDARDRVLHGCIQRGLVVLPVGKSAIRFIPPLSVTDEAVKSALRVVSESLKATR